MNQPTLSFALPAGGANGTAGAGEDEGIEDVDFEEAAGGGYSAAYAKLANAAAPERPVLAEIADPKQFVQSSLAQFMSSVGSS